MARIRTIKPEFFTDEDMAILSPLARLFYIGLWCEADREGRLEWKLKTLKWKYLPEDDCDIESIGKELLDSGRVILYTAENRLCALIPSFNKHQHINVREAASKLPAPVSTKRVRARASTDTADTKPVDARGEGKGRELVEEGKEEPPKSPRGDEHESFGDFFKAYPSRGKAANPRKPAAKAHLAAIKRGADPAELIRLAPTAASVEKHGTEFVPQSTTWLNEDRWKDVPALTVVAPAEDPEDARWKLRIDGFDRSGFWNRDQWGPAPNEVGCKAPKRFLPAAHVFDPVAEMPSFLKRTA